MSLQHCEGLALLTTATRFRRTCLGLQQPRTRLYGRFADSNSEEPRGFAAQDGDQSDTADVHNSEEPLWVCSLGPVPDHITAQVRLRRTPLGLQHRYPRARRRVCQDLEEPSIGSQRDADLRRERDAMFQKNHYRFAVSGRAT